MKSFDRTNLILLILPIIIFGCNRSPEEGVSIKLAKERKKYYHNIEYSINLQIPKERNQKITGSLRIDFDLYKKRRVILDFREKDSNIITVSIKGEKANYKFKNGHIILPSKYFSLGKNSIQIDFIAGETSLNRKDEFLYSLFVPDRASTAFPCFDQPNLKALYQLSLDIPEDWVAITNGSIENVVINDNKKEYVFSKTQPISTYLFAFVVGRFDSISRCEGNRKIIMYHRESDTNKVNRNLNAVFNSHFHSLSWLKEYTEISYPFGKLDFILVPDFQYSGMEHPGAIYYRDSRILLDENPSINQQLRQANLIAHEVSHQWFGDLVTMNWFNDVWMKEVFAGLMADKIVNPQYPEVNHNLGFLLSHYPRAYSVDRTMGANPIRQPLDNMLNAGTLYGDIIYHKAPIMMMQLELLMEKEWFRKGLIDYLSSYQMDNAGWEELVDKLKPYSQFNVNKWSHAWVYQPTMPKITAIIHIDSLNEITNYKLIQKRKEKALPMSMVYGLKTNLDSVSREIEIKQSKDTIIVYNMIGKKFPNWVLPNSDGIGYGYFLPDSISLENLLDTSNYITDPVSRASWFISLNEMFLDDRISNTEYFNTIILNLNKETDSQIRQYLLDALELIWWKFFSDNERDKRIAMLENSLVNLISSPILKDNERKPIFWTYIRILNSNNGRENLYKIWNETLQIKGVKLDEQDFMILAYEIGVRDYRNCDSILNAQEQKIMNTDRLAKFKFIRRAVSNEVKVRDEFFKCLSDIPNRRPEPWVTVALAYLHHPLRCKISIKYIKTSLDMLEEIQKTGDIFFPKSWLDATLNGYSSKEASNIVLDWLYNNPKVPKVLTDKVYQSADILFRAAK